MQESRVPGSELPKLVFYESIIGATHATTTTTCPYGCTIKETKQGPYLVDHVRRVAYPLSVYRSAMASASSTDSAADLVEVGAPSGSSGATSANVQAAVNSALVQQEAAMRMRFSSQIQQQEQLIRELTQTVKNRKDEVQALQRKLTTMHQDLKRESQRVTAAEALLRREQQLHSQGQARPADPGASAEAPYPPVRPADLLPRLTAEVVPAPLEAIDTGRVARRAERKREREGGDRLGKAPRETETSSAADKSSRVIRYGDARIGVADDDDSSSLSSSSSSSLFSSSSSSSSSRSSSRSRRSSSASRSRSLSPERSGNGDGGRREKQWSHPVEKASASSVAPPQSEEDRERIRRESYRTATTRRGPNVSAEAPASSRATNAAATATAPPSTNAVKGKEEPGVDPTAPPLRPVSLQEGNSTAAATAAPQAATTERVVARREGLSDASADPSNETNKPMKDSSPPGNIQTSPKQAPQQPVIPAVKSKATLPADVLQTVRGATVFCHVCRTFFAPHAVNLRQHILSSVHQRACAQVDQFIMTNPSFVKDNPVADREDAVWHRFTAQLRMEGPDAIKGRAQTNRSEFGKVTVTLPPYVVPSSTTTLAHRQKARAEGNSFFAEGFDLVRSVCSLCQDVVSAQSYKMHESTAKHREHASRQNNADTPSRGRA